MRVSYSPTPLSPHHFAYTPNYTSSLSLIIIQTILYINNNINENKQEYSKTNKKRTKRAKEKKAQETHINTESHIFAHTIKHKNKIGNHNI